MGGLPAAHAVMLARALFTNRRMRP